jgi:hypothetical protein
MASSSQKMRDADDLSRKELQTELKIGGAYYRVGQVPPCSNDTRANCTKGGPPSQLQPQHGKSLTHTKQWLKPACLPVRTAASAAPYPQQVMRDADDLSLTELLIELKAWGLSSSGTNASLRQGYASELHKRQSLSQLQQQRGKSLTHTKQWPMPTCLPVDTAASAASYPQPVSNTKNKKAPPRVKRYRSFAPAAVQQRISRAKTQHMYLIKRGDIQHGQEGATCCSCQFVVLGSTGNVYTVTIQKVANCTCPDHVGATCANTFCLFYSKSCPLIRSLP